MSRPRRLYPLSTTLTMDDQRAIDRLARERQQTRAQVLRDLICDALDRVSPEHVPSFVHLQWWGR